MKMYENPMLNISLFDAENIAANGSTVQGTALDQANGAALQAVGGNQDNVFNVRIVP